MEMAGAAPAAPVTVAAAGGVAAEELHQPAATPATAEQPAHRDAALWQHHNHQWAHNTLPVVPDNHLATPTPTLLLQRIAGQGPVETPFTRLVSRPGQSAEGQRHPAPSTSSRATAPHQHKQQQHLASPAAAGLYTHRGRS
jgi:hypothetical protein